MHAGVFTKPLKMPVQHARMGHCPEEARRWTRARVSIKGVPQPDRPAGPVERLSRVHFPLIDNASDRL